MITEVQIEKVIALLEQEDFQDSFAQDEAEYWHYLNSDSFKGLTTEEHQLCFFINSVIYHACTEALGELVECEIEKFQELEEANWAEREKFKTWADTKDSYFEKCAEEDLLAFVEDMLADEEEEISELSKEVIFITAKSYIEYLTQESA